MSTRKDQRGCKETEMNGMDAPNDTSAVRKVRLVALITAACLLGDSMLYVVLPTHWDEMGLTTLWEVGVLLSVNRFVRLPLSPLVGWLYRSLCKRTGILLAVTLAAVTTAGYGMAEGFWSLFWLRCLWGVAWTFLRLGAYFTIMDLADDHHRGYYFGTYNGLFRLGSLFGMLLGGILADSWGITPVSLAFSIMAAASIPVVLSCVAVERTGGVAPQMSTVSFSIWKRPTVTWTMLSGLCVALLFQGVVAAMLSHVIEGRLTFAPQIGGFLAGAAAIAGFLQALRWGWEPFLAPWFGRLSDGVKGRRKLFVTWLAAAALLFAMVPVQMPFWLWLFLFLGLQLTATALTTLMDAIASDVASRTSKLTVMTTYSMMTDLGAALGPSLGFTVGSWFGSEAAFAGAAAICGIMALRWATVSGDSAMPLPQESGSQILGK
jgi:MFS family permease